MANFSPLMNILTKIKSSIGNNDKDIWYGSTANDIKLMIDNIMVGSSRSNSIPLIEAQFTELENALREKVALETLAETYARKFAAYESILYQYNSGNQTISAADVNTAKRVMDIARNNMETKEREIENIFRKISRVQVGTVSPTRKEMPIYSIKIQDTEDLVIIDGLKRVVTALESFITELNKPLFESSVIHKTTVAPYQPIRVTFNISHHKNMVAANINDLINYINRLISRIELHIDNITAFENNEAVSIPQDISDAQTVLEQKVEVKPETYTVKKNDNLIAIAAIYGVDWKDILNANKDKIPNGDPRKLEIGTDLVIPGKTTEVITANVSSQEEIIGNEKLEATSDIPTIKPIADFSKVSSSNWSVACNEVVEGEYSSPVKLENGKMVDKNGTAFYISSKMSSYYNNDVYKSTGGRSGHTGTDFATGSGDYGTSISPLGPGVVIAESDTDNGGLGKYVKVLHEVIDDNGNVKYVVSVYGHLSKNNVEVGDVINGNEAIGSLGNTGNSTGAHLHLEMADVDLTAEEIKGKSTTEIIKIVKQKGIDSRNTYGEDNYYDMGVYYKSKGYID